MLTPEEWEIAVDAPIVDEGYEDLTEEGSICQ